MKHNRVVIFLCGMMLLPVTMATDVCGLSSDVFYDEHLVSLALKSQALQAQANELGYEWPSIQILQRAAFEAVQQLDINQAMTYYEAAIEQATLAILQAQYAAENWQMLVPY